MPGKGRRGEAGAAAQDGFKTASKSDLALQSIEKMKKPGSDASGKSGRKWALPRLQFKANFQLRRKFGFKAAARTENINKNNVCEVGSSL
jgi:hypothetical protein